MDTIFHYPPELMQLMVDTIPLLCRSKKDVLLFFKGAGVANHYLGDLATQVRLNRDSINKFDIARTVLTRLNQKGDATLRERREVLKRVVEFEDFSTCWPADHFKAKGYVAEIRRVVNVKDSFTRMDLERQVERGKRIEEQAEKLRAVRERKEALTSVRSDLSRLFGETNHQKRGKALESVLNRLFSVNEILVSEAFTRLGTEGEGIIEQVDGVVELDGHHYFVEMKWWDKPLGKLEVSQQLTLLFNRRHSRGIFISASGYTDPALAVCRDALSQTVVVLCKLEEIVLLLEQEGDLKKFLKTKVSAAITHKNPLHEPLAAKET